VSDAPRQAWERRPSENKRAWEGFLCYLNLGPGRSRQAAWEAYYHSEAQARKRHAKGTADKPAGTAPGYWTRWLVKWNWVGRAEAKDDFDHAAADEQRFEAELTRKAAEYEAEVAERTTTRGQLRSMRRILTSVVALAGPALQELNEAASHKDYRAHPKLLAILPHIPRVATAAIALLEAERKEEARTVPGDEARQSATPQRDPDEMSLEELRGEFERLRLAVESS
jgi:hypothetical protein